MANDLLLRDLNDIIEGDDFSKSNKNDKILIAIVSDSRKELIRSMRSAVENADNAYRIGFAVYAVNFKKDDIEDNVKGMDLYVKDADNIDFVDAHKFFAHVSEKYDYICYTDKHSRFNKLWDSAIVSMINHSEDKSNTVISLDLPDRRKREMVTVSANDYKNIFSSDTDVFSDRSMILFEAVHYYFVSARICNEYGSCNLNYNGDDSFLNGLVFYRSGFNILKPEEIQIWYQYIDISKF